MKSSIFTKMLALLLAITIGVGVLAACGQEPEAPTISITNGEEVEVVLNGTLKLEVVDGKGNSVKPKWSASNDCVTVSINGNITALKAGEAIVTASYNGATDKVLVKVTDDRELAISISSTSLFVGESATLSFSASSSLDTQAIEYQITAGADVISISGNTVNALKAGTATIVASTGSIVSNTLTVKVEEMAGDPYENVTKTEFYASYTPAKSYTDATYRTQHGLMSGDIVVPDQAPTIAQNRPTEGGQFVLNTDMIFLDNGRTYVVVDATGAEVVRIYYGGAYITLEEVAAYLYAFGDIPPNYSAGKKPSSAMWTTWGEYLRANHSNFSGSTSSYPYEPELPNITGCGGKLQYKELDIGTTGTTAGEGYAVQIYNNGSKITRGAARIVYGKQDLNNNGVYDAGELYLFYTYNHYNDFQEYLNYFGGWGEMFGNVTGGGTLSSKNDYNPTPYVPVARKSFSATATAAVCEYVIVTYLGSYTKQYV